MRRLAPFLSWLAFFVLVALGASAAPSAQVWYGDKHGLHGVDASTNEEALNVSFETPIALEGDPGDGSVWALAKKRLVRFNALGTKQVELPLQAFGGGCGAPRRLALAPGGASLWVGFENRVAHVSAEGAHLGSLEVRAEDIAAAADGSLWVLASNSLRHYGSSGGLLKSISLKGDLKQAEHLTLDEAGGALWLASRRRLFKMSLAAPSSASLSVAAPDVVELAKDMRSGELWVLGQRRLTAYDRDGKIVVARELCDVAITGPRSIVFDFSNQAVWVGYGGGLARLRVNGTLAATLSARGPVTALAAGGPPDGGGGGAEPVLTMVEPVNGALLTTNQPALVVQYSAQCGGAPCAPPAGFFEGLSLSARLNGVEVGPSFAFDPATARASFTPAPLSEGEATFSARAQDAAGRPSNELAISFTVDTIAPAFQGVTPADGGVFSAPPVVIQGSVNDPLATVTLGDQSQGANFFFPVLLEPGVNTFHLRAGDPAGNTSTLTLSYTFEPPNLAPAVSVVQPATGATFDAPASFNVVANAADPDGLVAHVEFFVGGSSFGVDGDAPYVATLADLPPGSYVLTARATDDRGASTVSEAVTVTVAAVGPPNAPPTVRITSPAAGTQFSAPATVVVAVEASDADGAVAQVEIFRDGAPAGTLTAPPYSITLTGVSAGTHVITARATDDRGAATASGAVSISVAATALAITSPAAGAAVEGENVLVRGHVTAPPNSGVVVNDEACALDASGNFSALAALTAGANVLKATLTTPDGTTLEQSVTVEATGASAAFYATATPTRGLSPLPVTFNVVNPTAQNATFTFDGFGPFSSPAGATSQLSITYPAGVFTPTVVFTDAAGRTFTRQLVIESQDPAALDQALRAAWGGMNQALVAGDKPGAMRYLNEGAKRKFGPVFDTLLPSMGAIVGSYSALARSSLSADMGEYAVARAQGGQRRLYMIYFLRDADGVWRVDEM